MPQSHSIGDPQQHRVMLRVSFGTPDVHSCLYSSWHGILDRGGTVAAVPICVPGACGVIAHSAWSNYSIFGIILKYQVSLVSTTKYTFFNFRWGRRNSQRLGFRKTETQSLLPRYAQSRLGGTCVDAALSLIHHRSSPTCSPAHQAHHAHHAKSLNIL